MIIIKKIIKLFSMFIFLNFLKEIICNNIINYQFYPPGWDNEAI
jgi:hypothetical protein